jgi:hypothetical protein
MRNWVSVNIGHGIRVGQSRGPEDRGPPRLPSWRKYELRQTLLKVGTAKTKEEANYIIDKALAGGLLDANGNLNFRAKGTKAEIIIEIDGLAKAWGQTIDAEALAERAIKNQRPLWRKLLPF